MAVQDKEPEVEAEAGSKEESSYYLAKCVLKGSVVLQAVYGHIRSPSTLDVVLGKETALELVVISEDGIVQSVCEQTVFGTIKDLSVLPWNEQHRVPQAQTYGKDLLVVLSDSGKLSFLTFSVEMHRFLAVAHIQLSHPGNMRRELGWLLAVECKGRAVAVGAFEDRVAVFPVSSVAGNNIVEKRILYPREPVMQVETEVGRRKGRETITAWGTVWSMSFVSNESEGSCKGMSHVVLAVLLHRRGAVENELQLLVCDTTERAIHLRARFSATGPLALNVVGIPDVPGFALLLRQGDLLLLDLTDQSNPCPVSRIRLNRLSGDGERNFVEGDKGMLCGGHEGDEEGSFNVAASALLELSDSGTNSMDRGEAMCIDGDQRKISSSSVSVCSWSWEPNHSSNQRLVLCLDAGEIFIAEFLPDGQDGIKINVNPFRYKCSPCKEMLWTKGGFIASFVEMGDGQVLKIEEGILSFRSLIQNIAPILDIALVDYHNEQQDQMFACCGVGCEGSLRIIRNGINVEKLLSTPPIYEGITGTWTICMKHSDCYHSFLVISFVEETRVLSVGLNFVDITDAIGFHPNACTLTCGLVEDGWLVQVCQNEVRLCAPTTAAHSEGLALPSPLCVSWIPNNASISLGAISRRTIILAMSSPGTLLMLGIRILSSGDHELYEIQQVKLQAELSCISIPQEELSPTSVPASIIGLIGEGSHGPFPSGVEIGKICVVGTHKPSVELLSIVPGENFTALAVGSISLTNTMGTAVSGCVPQDVRLVLFDRLYILSGLRNGMLLRYEWPASSVFPSELPSSSPLPAFMSPLDGNISSYTVAYECCQCQDKCTSSKNDMTEGSFPVQLQLIAVRRVGTTPVFLVPLCNSLQSDIIALSDRPWLLQTARHSQRIAYTSISFQPATHVTPVNAVDCPKGILFVADCSLHLVEMVNTKRLNVQKHLLGSTPRRILYHPESKTLLVMRTECQENVSNSVSDICCVDPLSGSLLSSYRFEAGESVRCMQLLRVGNEEFLVVGTGLSSGRAIMPSGEAEMSKGRLLTFQLQPIQISGSGMVHSSSASSSVAAPGSPFCDGMRCTPEHEINNNLNGSPDEASHDGVRFEEGGGWELTLKGHVSMPGIVLVVCPYLGRYILASAGNTLFCLGYQQDSPQRLRRYAFSKTRFAITSIAVHLNRIAVGDCRDGILFYSYQEDQRKLEQLYCDPVQRLVADCVLIDLDTALVSDRRGSFCALSCPNLLEENASPERNLKLSCWYHMGETIMRIHKVAETRFASHIIVLRRLVQVKDALQGMVISNNWGVWKQKNTERANKIKERLLADSWWERVGYLLKITEPIMSMLRYADMDRPCLGEIYDGIDSMIEKIKQVINEQEQDPQETFFKQVQKIINERWNKMTTPLHLLAYALTPKYYSSQYCDLPGRLPPYRDMEVSDGYQAAFRRIFPDDDIRDVIMDEFIAFVNATDLSNDALRHRFKKHAHGWWYLHGQKFRTLQPLAIKVISQGSFSYKVPIDDGLRACNKNGILLDIADSTVVASTLLGTVVIFIRLSREDYDLLDAVQERLASYPLSAPVLGNNHAQFRGRDSPVGVCKVLDGDMLAQFLELTSTQQRAVLAAQPTLASDTANSANLQRSLPLDQVLRLLERVHNAQN